MLGLYYEGFLGKPSTEEKDVFALMKTSNPARELSPCSREDGAWIWVLMNLPSPVSVSSWDLDSSNPCLEGELQGKCPKSHSASPWKLGAVSSCSQSCGRGGLSVRSSSLQGACGCHQSLPPALSPSSALSCPVSPAQPSRQLPAMLGDHGTPDSKCLLLHPSVFFSPTLMHLSPTPDLPKLLPSLILFPKHTQSLLFAVVCAFLWHPQSSWSSSSYSSPPTVTGENKSSPSLAVVCFSALKPALFPAPHCHVCSWFQ